MIKFFVGLHKTEKAAPRVGQPINLLVQFQTHEDKFLPPGETGTESAWVSAVFREAHALIERNGVCVVRHHFQFQLRVSGLFRALDTGFCQRPPDSDTPAVFYDTDTELGAVSDFLLCPHSVNPGQPDNVSVDFRDYLNITLTVRFRLKKVSLPLLKTYKKL